MTGWEIFGIVLGLVVLALIVFNFRDLCRYIKISSM
jgi:hypothetical protein